MRAPHGWSHGKWRSMADRRGRQPTVGASSGLLTARPESPTRLIACSTSRGRRRSAKPRPAFRFVLASIFRARATGLSRTPRMTSSAGGTPLAAWCHGAPGVALAETLAPSRSRTTPVSPEIEAPLPDRPSGCPAAATTCAAEHWDEATSCSRLAIVSTGPRSTAALALAERVTERALRAGHFRLGRPHSNIPCSIRVSSAAFRASGACSAPVGSGRELPSVLGFECACSSRQAAGKNANDEPCARSMGVADIGRDRRLSCAQLEKVDLECDASDGVCSADLLGSLIPALAGAQGAGARAGRRIPAANGRDRCGHCAGFPGRPIRPFCLGGKLQPRPRRLESHAGVAGRQFSAWADGHHGPLRRRIRHRRQDTVRLGLHRRRGHARSRAAKSGRDVSGHDLRLDRRAGSPGEQRQPVRPERL